MKQLYTVKEVAQILKLSVRTIYTLIEDGKIETVRIGNSVRVREEQVKKFTEGE